MPNGQLIMGSVPKMTQSVLDNGTYSLPLSADAGVGLCAHLADRAYHPQIHNPCRQPFVHTHQTLQATKGPLLLLI